MDDLYFKEDDKRDFFNLGISLDDFHLEQPAISVEKIANLIQAAVNYYPELILTFGTIKGKWKDRAYPALRDELKKRGLNLEYNDRRKKFELTSAEQGIKKTIHLSEALPGCLQ